MNYEMKDNTGTLFRNEKKQSETQPDYRGEALVNGESVWMSAWLNTSAKGTKYMKFAFSPKEERPQQTQQPIPVVDEDIPFS